MNFLLPLKYVCDMASLYADLLLLLIDVLLGVGAAGMCYPR